MSRITDGMQRELVGVLSDAASRLGPARVATLIGHPEAVRSALAATADVLTVDDSRRRAAVETMEGSEPRPVGAAEASRRVSAPTGGGAPETLLTSDELAARAGLKIRQTVHDWLKKGRIVGWQDARRGYVFPADQFDNRDRPLAGLDRVVAQFGDGYAAWVWLTTPQPSLDGETPLALLVGGEIDRVENAAQGDRQGDFA